MKLVLGVVDILYTEPQPASNKPRKKSRQTPSQTTGDVAEILEEKYGVMQAFFNAHTNDIAEQLEEAVAVALDNVMNGFPAPPKLFDTASDEIGGMMKEFISSGEAERVGISGTPTEAALRGVNHRLKHPCAKANPRRPSFIDTDQYRASMKAWTED
jgi:hypothetical protein